MLNTPLNTDVYLEYLAAQSAGAVEYADCFSANG